MHHRWSVNLSTKLPDSLYSHCISKWWWSKCHTEIQPLQKKKTRQISNDSSHAECHVALDALCSAVRKPKPQCVFFNLRCQLHVRPLMNAFKINLLSYSHGSLGIRALTCWKECESQEPWVSSLTLPTWLLYITGIMDFFINSRWSHQDVTHAEGGN